MPPPDMFWYCLYCVVNTVYFLMLLVFGAALASKQPEPFEKDIGDRWFGALVAAISLLMVAAFVVGLVSPARPWTWTFGLVLIVLGMGCLPLSIPLLIFWVKPETRKYFHGKDYLASKPCPQDLPHFSR